MREFPRIEWRPLDIISTDGYHAGEIEIFSGIGGDESCLGQEIGMQHIEGQSPVFLDDQLEPIHQRIVDTFVRAEACDLDAVVDVSSSLGRGQVHARTKNVYMVSCGCE